MPVEERKTIVERVPTEIIFKQKILEILEIISAYHQRSLFFIQNFTFSEKIDSEAIETLYNYFAWVVTLYKIIKPKLMLEKFREKYSKLFEMDNYVENILVGGKSLERVIAYFVVFSHFEDLLRDACEELGYTSDKPL